MRNVQQWQRDLDNSVIRVFPFGGKMKTAATFLEGTSARFTNPRHIRGVGMTTGPADDPADHRLFQGNYILLRSDKSITVLTDEDDLFAYMGKLGYRYKGNERVRNTQLSSDMTDLGLIRRWGIWADKIQTTHVEEVVVSQPVQQPDKIYPQRDELMEGVDEHYLENAAAYDPRLDPQEVTSMSDTTKVSVDPHAPAPEPVRTDSPEPFQWQKEGIAAKPVDEEPKTAPKKRKTFAERLLGFLDIFR